MGNETIGIWTIRRSTTHIHWDVHRQHEVKGKQVPNVEDIHCSVLGRHAPTVRVCVIISLETVINRLVKCLDYITLASHCHGN